MKNFFAYVFLVCYLRFILITCKWDVKNISILENILKTNKPVMLSCWHERLVFLACFFKDFKKTVWIISSQHNDSQILGKVLKKWGYSFIKGSSSKGWFSVIKQTSLLLKKQNSILAITNDGPKGPPKKAKVGSFKIALKNNVSIVGMSGISSSFWTLNSWDKLKIPKPFSTIYISFYKEYSGGDNLVLFNSYLNKNQKDIDGCVGF